VTWNRAAMVQLGLLLVAGVVLRVLALGVEGHDGDVRVTSRWAEHIAAVGPWGFYEGDGSIYPALLYPLWAMGAALDGEALAVAVKAMSIPFDVAIGVVLFLVMRDRAGDGRALGVSALFLLNPAAVLAGPVWGQVDSAGTLPYLGALVALAAGRHGLAGGLAVLATLVKPQFGLAVLPVLVVAALHARRAGDAGPLGRAIGGMAVAGLAIAVPLALWPWRYAEMLADTAVRQPETSLNAFNPWGLVVGFGIPDDPYVLTGTLLLALGILGSLSVLRHRPDLAVVLATGALLALAFYFLPTRVHERYLYPAIAVLAPFALAGRAQLAAYVALSLSFSVALLYALHETTPFDLPEPVAGWVTSEAGIWATGVVLVGSAVGWAWLLGVRRPRLPRRQSPARGP